VSTLGSGKSAAENTGKEHAVSRGGARIQSAAARSGKHAVSMSTLGSGGSSGSGARIQSAAERTRHGVSYNRLAGIKDFASHKSTPISSLSVGLEDEVLEAASSLHQMAVVRDQLKNPLKGHEVKTSRKDDKLTVSSIRRTSLAKRTDDEILTMRESNVSSDKAGENLISEVTERVKDDKTIASDKRSMIAIADDSTMIPDQLKSPLKEHKGKTSRKDENLTSSTRRMSLTKFTDDEIFFMKESNVSSDKAGEISKVSERVKDEKRIASDRSMVAIADDSTMISLNTEKRIREKYTPSGNEDRELTTIVVVPKRQDRIWFDIKRKSDVFTDSDFKDGSTKAAVDTEKRMSEEDSATLGGSTPISISERRDEKRIATGTKFEHLFMDYSSEKRTGVEKITSASTVGIIDNLFSSEKDRESVPSPQPQKVPSAWIGDSTTRDGRKKKESITDEDKERIFGIIESDSDLSDSLPTIDDAENNDAVKEDVEVWVSRRAKTEKSQTEVDDTFGELHF
jgi:hypothetical protein